MNVPSGDSPENNLSKFGILPDMKVGKKKKKRILLHSCYLLELIIKIEILKLFLFSPKIWQIYAIKLDPMCE
jgi:hypothetical protein